MSRAFLTRSNYRFVAGTRAQARATNVLLVVAYVIAYVFLDWVSYIHPAGPYAITAWNPPPGVSLALLLGFGLRYAPALFVAAVLAEPIVRYGEAEASAIVIYALILSAGYTALAAALRRLDFDPAFRSLRDLILFVVVVGAGTIAIAALYVASHAAAGQLPWSAFATHTLHFWVGDVIGIATTTPFLLVHGRRLADGHVPRVTTEGVMQAVGVAAVLVLIFHVEPQRAANLFYLMFLPLVWISTRYGFEGATAGVAAIQLGLIAVFDLAAYPTQWVLQFELEMLALTVTGAFLGMTSTQWREARRALESREAELKTIFATAPDAIVTLDERHRVVDANPAAAALFAMSASTLRQQTLPQLIVDLPPDISAARAVAARARRRDGGTFPVEVSFGSATVGQRQVHIGVIRDVTERREMEESLQERDQHLERTLRVAAAAEMASALAHELNQPLTAASAYVQSLELLLARRHADDEGLTDAMRKTAGEVDRAGNIVRRLREFYRRDAGHVEAVAPAAIIADSLELLKNRIERHRIMVDTQIAADVPALFVNRVQIEMVLHNVLRNAVDALAESEPEVRRIAIAVERGQPGLATISVEDSGPGVKPAIARELFKSFVSTRAQGTGLGLAISRSIVERHGGRLWLGEGRTGARFLLTLPVVKE